MIIWLASYPRSGSTFCRLMLHRMYGINTYSKSGDNFFLANDMSDTIGVAPLPRHFDDLDRDEAIHFVKTHDLPTDNRPAIYLVRDGRDSLVSYARFLMFHAQTNAALLRPLKQALGLLDPRTVMWHLVLPSLGQVGWQARFQHPRTLPRALLKTHDRRHGGWGTHVETWHARPATTATIYFAHLIQNPVEAITSAMETLNLAPPPANVRPPTFEELHARWPHFFRRGKVGAWRDEMPADIHEAFWQYHGETMTRMGFDKSGLVSPKLSPTMLSQIG